MRVYCSFLSNCLDCSSSPVTTSQVHKIHYSCGPYNGITRNYHEKATALPGVRRHSRSQQEAWIHLSCRNGPSIVRRALSLDPHFPAVILSLSVDLTATLTGPAADPHFVVTKEPLLRVHPSFLDRLSGFPQLHRDSVAPSLDFLCTSATGGFGWSSI